MLEGEVDQVRRTNQDLLNEREVAQNQLSSLHSVNESQQKLIALLSGNEGGGGKENVAPFLQPGDRFEFDEDLTRAKQTADFESNTKHVSPQPESAYGSVRKEFESDRVGSGRKLVFESGQRNMHQQMGSFGNSSLVPGGPLNFESAEKTSTLETF